MLDLESEAMRGLGSIPTGGNIFCPWIFSHSKASDANIGIIANVVCLWKTPNSPYLKDGDFKDFVDLVDFDYVQTEQKFLPKLSSYNSNFNTLQLENLPVTLSANSNGCQWNFSSVKILCPKHDWKKIL